MTAARPVAPVLTQDALATKADIDRVEAMLRTVMQRLDQVAPPEVWFGINAAAERLRVSPSTIRRKIASGEIEARGVGKTRQVRL